jgi:hypothetical protein
MGPGGKLHSYNCILQRNSGLSTPNILARKLRGGFTAILKDQS